MNGTTHPPQWRVLAFAAVGGAGGSMLAILLMCWLCGCPCGLQDDDRAPTAVTAPAATAN